MNRITIIGGGAAGIMCAALLAKHGRFKSGGLSCTVYTGGRPLHKLSLTGKGRCNLTNTEPKFPIITAGIGNTNGHKNDDKFLLSALSKFSAEDTMRFFENIGVPVKIERGGRVFPQSDDARDICAALLTDAKKNNVTLISDTVTSLEPSGGGYIINKSVRADTVILATGGLSYPKTGCGRGYNLARQCGHTVTDLRGGLLGADTAEDVSGLAGLSLRNIRVSFTPLDCVKPTPAAERLSQQSELLFTKTGVSGPAVLTLTACYPVAVGTLCIDLKPALSREQLTRRLQDECVARTPSMPGAYSAKQLKTLMTAYMPKTLTPLFLEKAKVSPDRLCGRLSEQERNRVVSTLKALPLTLTGARPIDEAVITIGGICLSEINPKTMESKICPNLYFAGEIIDAAALTGGYNLQIAWSTAYAAAKGIIDKCQN